MRYDNHIGQNKSTKPQKEHEMSMPNPNPQIYQHAPTPVAGSEYPPPVEHVHHAEMPEPVNWVEIDGKVDQAAHGQLPRYPPVWVRWKDHNFIAGIVSRIRRWSVSDSDKYPLKDGREEYLTYNLKNPYTGVEYIFDNRSPGMLNACYHVNPQRGEYLEVRLTQLGGGGSPHKFHLAVKDPETGMVTREGTDMPPDRGLGQQAHVPIASAAPVSAVPDPAVHAASPPAPAASIPPVPPTVEPNPMPAAPAATVTPLPA